MVQILFILAQKSIKELYKLPTVKQSIPFDKLPHRAVASSKKPGGRGLHVVIRWAGCAPTLPKPPLRQPCLGQDVFRALRLKLVVSIETLLTI